MCLTFMCMLRPYAASILLLVPKLLGGHWQNQWTAARWQRVPNQWRNQFWPSLGEGAGKPGSECCPLLVSLILKLQHHLPLGGSAQLRMTQHPQHLQLEVTAVEHRVEQAGVSVDKRHQSGYGVSQADEVHGRLGTLFLRLAGRAEDPGNSGHKGPDDRQLGVWRSWQLLFAPVSKNKERNRHTHTHTHPHPHTYPHTHAYPPPPTHTHMQKTVTSHIGVLTPTHMRIFMSKL